MAQALNKQLAEQLAQQAHLVRPNEHPDRPRFRPMNPLCDAAEQGDLPTLTRLIATGTDVNTVGENGNTAIAFACANGHADCTAFLASKGADVNKASALGNCPLHAACWAESIKCIRILIKAKADVNAHRPGGSTPMQIAIQGARHEAVEALIAHNADMSLKKDGKTPLQLALSMGHRECEAVIRRSIADVARKERELLEASRQEAEARANAAAEALLAELELEEAGSTSEKKGKTQKQKQGKRAAAKAAKASAAACATNASVVESDQSARTARASGKLAGSTQTGGLGHACTSSGTAATVAANAAAANAAADNEGVGELDEEAAMAKALRGPRRETKLVSAPASVGSQKNLIDALMDQMPGAPPGVQSPPRPEADDDLDTLDETDGTLSSRKMTRARTVERCPVCGSRAKPTKEGRCPACFRNVLGETGPR
jgi:hypothetical protein